MKYQSLCILLILITVISCDNNETMAKNIIKEEDFYIARGENRIICFGDQYYSNFSFILSTNVINISAIASLSNYEASVYSEDGEIYSLFYSQSVYERAKDPTEDGIIGKFIYQQLHTIHCNDPYGCILHTSPFKKTCISITSNIDANYQIIVHRCLKLSTILYLFTGLMMIHYAPSISQYKLYYYLSFTGLGTIFSLFFILYYILHRYAKGGSGFFVGVIATIGFATNKWLPFITSLAENHPYIVITYLSIALIVSIFMTYWFSSYFNPNGSMGYIVKWLIRDIGLLIIFCSIPSVIYGLIITGLVFAYCNLIDLLPKKVDEENNEEDSEKEDNNHKPIGKKVTIKSSSSESSNDDKDDEEENLDIDDNINKKISKGMINIHNNISKIDPESIDLNSVDKEMIAEALNTMRMGLENLCKAISPHNSKHDKDD